MVPVCYFYHHHLYSEILGPRDKNSIPIRFCIIGSYWLVLLKRPDTGVLAKSKYLNCFHKTLSLHFLGFVLASFFVCVCVFIVVLGVGTL
jgi:hypothetical protein